MGACACVCTVPCVSNEHIRFPHIFPVDSSNAFIGFPESDDIPSITRYTNDNTHIFQVKAKYSLYIVRAWYGTEAIHRNEKFINN